MQRFTILEGWRALLCWWVVLAHTISRAGFSRKELAQNVKETQVSGFDPAGWLNHMWAQFVELAAYGKLPVYVFILLSGFVITHLLMQKRESYGVYIMRRFLRLWPALAFSLALFGLFWLLGLSGRNIENFWTHLALEASMFQGLIPNQILENASGRINGPLWSVSLEWQFYLVAPIIIFGIIKGGWRAALVISALLAALFVSGLNDRRWQVLGEQFTWNAPAALPQAIGFFAMGIASYWLFRQVRENGDRPTMPMLSVILCAMLAIGFFGPEGDSVPLMIWVIIFAMLVTSGSILHRFVDSKILSWLGTISYSTYVVHMFVLAETHRHIVRRMTDTETLYQFLLMIAIAWPLTIALSAFSYYFIERPSINFGRSLAKRWTAKETPDTQAAPQQDH